MKKNLIVYFSKEGWSHITHPYEGIRPNVEEKQEALLNAFPTNVNIYIARSETSHIQWNIFQPQYIREKGLWTPYTWDNIEADLVIGFNIPKAVTRIFNTVREITHDKTYFENIFPDYSIQSVVCYTYEDIEKAFKNIQTSLKVLKPLKWTRSKWIFIQEDIPKKQDIETSYYPYLLQEFFDTSWWFYEYSWIHDFRIIMLWWNIIWKFLRQPEVWKYTANSFRKWNLIDLTDWELPDEIQKIVSKIESYCIKRFEHRYYSIDFGIWKNGNIKVFEMNSAPGLTTDYIAHKLWSYIAKNILKVC